MTVSALQLEVAPAQAFVPLEVVTRLCRGLQDAGVGYCHWKSNEHLRPAALGETDLDLLVDRAAAVQVAQVLSEAGYKRMMAVAARSYVGIEDYLALDQATGKLVHLHLHHRLVVGEKFLKGYRLPWEDRLLATRQLDRDTGIHVSAPEMELLILLIRAALKLRRRETLGFGRGGSIDADFMREFRWLAARIDSALLQARATELLGPHAASVLGAIVAGGPDRTSLRRLRQAMRGSAEAWRTYPAIEATRRRWLREWNARSARLWSRLTGRRRVTRFQNPRGGVIIAFLGADGSGKSTVTQAVTSWLSWRIEVVPLYLGFGDGPVSGVRKPLQALKSLYARRHGSATLPASAQASPRAARAPSVRDVPKAVWRILWSWSVVREKRARIREAQQGRNLGLTVICDRYPQAQIMALGDGPLMSYWVDHPWGWLRAAARWELEAYRRLETVAPDLVIKLHVTPEVSARRKRDVSLDSLARRVEVVRQVQFGNDTRVAQVDATQSLAQVLLDTKRIVWEAL